MRRWCLLSAEMIVPDGYYLEARLFLRSRGPLEDEHDFIATLALRLMARYESQPVPPPLVLLDLPLSRPERNKSFYRRLFTANGDYTEDFITWASETLGAWLEESFEPVLCVAGGRPHGNEPVWDAITVIEDTAGVPRLRLVQVKATKSGLQDNCNIALRKFALAEAPGYYDAELLTELTLLQERSKLPPQVQPRDLLYDRQRRYRVTVMHAEDRDSLRILTTYADKVRGDLDRRSARLIFVHDWSVFWQRLAVMVYGSVNELT